MKRVYSDYDIQVYRLFKKYKRQQMSQINVEYAKTIRIELFTLGIYTHCRYMSSIMLLGNWD